uniref:Uncharacterized protein n=1 Tax=Arundo donax TaxID=35708 RepID=A0A0A9B8G8_ARUDO
MGTIAVLQVDTPLATRSLYSPGRYTLGDKITLLSR